MSDSATTWKTDFRWRRLRVSSKLLSELLQGNMLANCAPPAPNDLTVIGLTEVSSGPDGYYEFLVWSAIFAPTPNDGERPVYPIILADFEVP